MNGRWRIGRRCWPHGRRFEEGNKTACRARASQRRKRLRSRSGRCEVGRSLPLSTRCVSPPALSFGFAVSAQPSHFDRSSRPPCPLTSTRTSLRANREVSLFRIEPLAAIGPPRGIAAATRYACSILGPVADVEIPLALADRMSVAQKVELRQSNLQRHSLPQLIATKRSLVRAASITPKTHGASPERQMRCAHPIATLRHPLTASHEAVHPVVPDPGVAAVEA